MLGGFLALLSAVSFAYANASVRRGVLSGTVLQAVGISLPVALPIFLLVMLPIGGYAALAAFDARSWTLLVVAGVIHFAWAAIAITRRPRRSAPTSSRRCSNTA